MPNFHQFWLKRDQSLKYNFVILFLDSFSVKLRGKVPYSLIYLLASFFLKVRTKDRVFDSISHLINYHLENNLPIVSSVSELCLQQPAERKH